MPLEYLTDPPLCGASIGLMQLHGGAFGSTRLGSSLEESPHPTFVICGSGSLALRLAKDLMRLGEPVAVILGNSENPFAQRIARTGARIVYGSKRDSEVLREAGVSHAQSLALVDSDDVGNVHTALAAQELNPQLRLVMRMHRRRLAARIESLFDECTLLSPADIAAPAFVDAVLGDGSHLVRVAGKVLRAGPPESVTSVLVRLAETNAYGNIDLLPPRRRPDQPTNRTVDFVLGEPAVGVAELAKIPPLETLITAPRPKSWVAAYRPPRWRTLLSYLSALTSARLRILALVLMLLIGVTVLGFQLFWQVGWMNALLNAVAVVTATGYDGLIGADVPGGMKVFGTGAMLLGLFLMAILIASVVDDFISERRGQRFSVPMGKPTGHVVTCGLGRVGIRVAEHLLGTGLRVVAIEQGMDNPRLAAARKIGLPVINGDCRTEEVLREARVEQARCVLAVTSDDITNLETGLAVRAMLPSMPVVLRLFEGDLARRVDQRLEYTISRSVSFATAPVFAAAMLDRAVLAVIPHGPRVLLVAELPINPGSDLYRQPIAALDRDGEVRVLAHQRGTTVDWTPNGQTVLGADDRLFVVATRDGLSTALRGTTDMTTL